MKNLQKPLGLTAYQDTLLVIDESLQSIVLLQNEQTIVIETLPCASCANHA